MATCVDCAEEIPVRRGQAMPGTRWCVRCAEAHTSQVGGVMVWDHKTAPRLEVMPMAKAKRFASLTRRRNGCGIVYYNT